MDGIVYSRTKSGFLAFAVVATLLVSLMWSAAGAQAAGAATCSAQSDRVARTLASGSTIDRAQLDEPAGLPPQPAGSSRRLARASNSSEQHDAAERRRSAHRPRLLQDKPPWSLRQVQQ